MTKDWMAEYNRYLEEQGESATIGVIRILGKTGERIEVLDSHLRNDGINGLASGMKQAGYAGVQLRPKKTRKRPPFVAILPHLLNFLFEEFRPRKPLAWKSQNIDRNFKTYGTYAHAFTVEETNALKARSKDAEVSIVPVLLKAVSDATNEVLMNESGVTRWHIPVDIRTFKAEDTSFGNHISNFICEIHPPDTPLDIHHQNLRKLKSGSFFAADFFLNLGNYPGCAQVLSNKVRGDYKKIRTSPRITGSFGYIGSWPKAGTVAPTSHPDEIVIPFGNVSLMNPICVTAMTWKRQLTLGIRLHSSIVSSTAGDADGNRLLESIVKKIRGSE
jgi:hypothetical protein